MQTVTLFGSLTSDFKLESAGAPDLLSSTLHSFLAMKRANHGQYELLSAGPRLTRSWDQKQPDQAPGDMAEIPSSSGPVHSKPPATKASNKGVKADSGRPPRIDVDTSGERDAVISVLRSELGRVTDALKASSAAGGQGQESLLAVLKDTQRSLEGKTVEVEELRTEIAVWRERVRALSSGVSVDVDQNSANPAAPRSPTTKALFVDRPSSPAAKEILKQKMDVAYLPPDDWAQEVSTLNYQLVTCLEEMAKQERRLKEYEDVVNLYESRLKLIDVQHHELYKDFATQKKVFTLPIMRAKHLVPFQLSLLCASLSSNCCLCLK